MLFLTVDFKFVAIPNRVYRLESYRFGKDNCFAKKEWILPTGKHDYKCGDDTPKAISAVLFCSFEFLFVFYDYI